MSTNEKYIIDANVLITAYKQYYGFDIVPKFWDYLSKEIQGGRIIIIDKVINEINVGGDKLSKWITNVCNNNVFDSLTCIDDYSLIINYIRDCGFYKESAMTDWAVEHIADAWIIASAKKLGCSIITNEKAKNDRNINNKQGSAKIPDIAKDFNISCFSIFDVLRDNKVVLS